MHIGSASPPILEPPSLSLMYGQPPPFRPGGGGRGVAQLLGQQQIHPYTNIFPNPSFFLPQLNPTFLPHPNPYQQNPNSFPQIQQQVPYSNFSFQTNPDNHSFQAPAPPPTSGSNNINFLQQHVTVQKKMVEEVDKAAMGAWRELLESNENVSAWKVSQAALLKVKADSWKSLGYEMHQVPSLSRLLAIEQKIHAFIHCFVAGRRITSLSDLEVAICESEGVDQFEELELGPLLRHPLVVQSFSVNSDLTEIYRITTEEIISCLCEFIDSHKKKEFRADTFLDFVSKKKSVSGREKLCVRVKQLGEYINHIKQARQSEDRVLDKCYEKMRTTSVKRSRKRPLFSAKKQELDDHFTATSERMKSFSSENTQSCGKHTRFASSSSDDDDDDREANEYANNQDEKNAVVRMKSFSSKNTQFCGKHTRFASSSSDDDDDSEANEYANNQDEKNTENNCIETLPNATSDRVSSCPYPSATEEMTRLGLKSELEFDIPPTEMGSEMNIEVDPTSITQGGVLLEPDISEPQSNVSSNLVAPSMNLVLGSADLDLPDMKMLDMKMFVPLNRTGERGLVSAQQQQAMLTGRLGELVAFRYFVGKVGDVFVKWVNETNETGLPYDIVLGGDDENSREYVEVKATKSGRKNWFLISMREWQFAVEKGESFSIAHVVLADNNMAKVTVYKNLARLCQLGNLRLAVVVPRE